MNFQLEKHNLWEIGVCTPVKRKQNLSHYFPTLNYCIVMNSMISSFLLFLKNKIRSIQIIFVYSSWLLMWKRKAIYWGSQQSSTHCISSIQRKVPINILRLQRVCILCNFDIIHCENILATSITCPDNFRPQNYIIFILKNLSIVDNNFKSALDMRSDLNK